MAARSVLRRVFAASTEPRRRRRAPVKPRVPGEESPEGRAVGRGVRRPRGRAEEILHAQGTALLTQGRGSSAEHPKPAHAPRVVVLPVVVRAGRDVGGCHGASTRVDPVARARRPVPERQAAARRNSNCFWGGSAPRRARERRARFVESRLDGIKHDSSNVSAGKKRVSRPPGARTLDRATRWRRRRDSPPARPRAAARSTPSRGAPSLPRRRFVAVRGRARSAASAAFPPTMDERGDARARAPTRPTPSPG